MSKKQTFLLILAILLSVLLLISCKGADEAPAAGDQLSATLNEIQGTVRTIPPDGGAVQEAQTGQVVVVDEQVVTLQESRARMDLSNGTIVRLGPQTSFTLKNMGDGTETNVTLLDLEIGDLWIILNGGALDVDTPAGMASVRGSYIHVFYNPTQGGMVVDCLEGTCQVENDLGPQVVKPGTYVNVSNMQSPPVPGQMSAESIGQWVQMNPEAVQVIPSLTLEPGGSSNCTPPAGWQPIQVASGDSLENLASFYGTTAQEIATGNCLNINTSLETGQIIYLPPLSGPNATPTPSPESTQVIVECGPPDSWVPITIQPGMTIVSVSSDWGIAIAQLQKANCMGNSQAIVPGMTFFVPNVPTVTPEFTATPTIDATIEVVLTDTAGDDYELIEVEKYKGPANETITECSNLYMLTLSHGKWVKSVFVQFSIGTPDFTSYGQKALDFITFNEDGSVKYRRYLAVDTGNLSLPAKIYWRFKIEDVHGAVFYYPSHTEIPFYLKDGIGCDGYDGTVPIETYVTFNDVPPMEGETITSCNLTFDVDIDSPQGVYWAKAWIDTSADMDTPQEFLLSHVSEDNYAVTVPSTLHANQTGYWKFLFKDQGGNIYYSDAYYYTSKECGGNSPTSFTDINGREADITAPSECTNDYYATITDANGITDGNVFLQVSQDDNTFANPTNILLIHVGSHKWIVSGASFALDSAAPVQVFWRFKVIDNAGVTNYSTYKSYIDTCGSCTDNP